MNSKLMLTLIIPQTVDVDKFFETIITQVKGRYGNARYVNDLGVPKVNYRAFQGWYKSGTIYSIYDIDAAELEPVIISVLDEFKKYIDFDFNFRVNGKAINNQNFWRINYVDDGIAFEEVDGNGKVNYDVDAAREAAETYNTKLATLS